MKNFWRKAKEALREALAPSDARCICCGDEVFDRLGFCENCLKEVTFNNGKTCKLCGVALHGEEDYCGNCAFEKNYFDRCFSPFCYDGAVKKAILKLKFGKIATNAKVFARYLVYCVSKNDVHFDLVTFVPMTKRARKQRGYNQAQLLAEYFCDTMDIDAPVKLLEKVKETQRQETLNKAQRKENLVGAFVATTPLDGKNILLIDDIKTTGSTLNQCARALKKKGAKSVVCLTVASREEKTAWEIEEEV